MKERCLIWREDDGEESREAALVRRGDRLCIEEISRGPLTRAMFGASPYGRRIVIEGEFAPAVLAHALYADSTQDLEVVLRQFFQVGGGRRSVCLRGLHKGRGCLQACLLAPVPLAADTKGPLSGSLLESVVRRTGFEPVTF